MNQRLLMGIIAIQALVIIGLCVAVTWFGRDEFRVFAQREENEVVAPSRVAERDGMPVVKLGQPARTASGISVQPLQAYALEAEARLHGSVVALQGLHDLRARWLAAQQEARILRPAVERSAAEYRRVLALFRDDRNASERAVQTAEAEWKSEQARLAAAQAQVDAARSGIAAQWGDAVAGLATAADAASWRRLAQGEDTLVQMVMGQDVPVGKEPASLMVAPLGQDQAEREATLLAPSPQADPVQAGRTYFYRAPGRDLRLGMRVQGRQKVGGTRAGVIVPAAAVVWHAGKAWVYRQVDGDSFMRREVATRQSVGDGWFDGGMKPGERVVVSGAQLLLSEEFRYQIKNENND